MALATFAYSRLQIEGDRDIAARTEGTLKMARRRYFFFLIHLKLGRNRASTHSYDEADDDYLPSVRELLQTPFLTRP